MNQIYSRLSLEGGIKKIFFFLFILCLFATAGIAQPEKDGAVTITTANTVVNRYTRVTADVLAGSNVVNVTDINELNRDGIAYLPAGYVTNGTVYASNAIGTGDLIMLYQAQGAVINSTNSSSYGEVTNNNGAGTYELAYVQSVAGNAITLSCGTKLSYFTARYVQVIRVPQYTTLTVDAAASVVAIPWGAPSFGGADPSALQRRKGGMVAAIAANISNDGSINANTAGFRGGTRENSSNFTATTFYTDFRSTDPLISAEKGESIAGYRDDYDNLYGGRYGRGAAANGGGGGNSHNSGGGGGANGGNPANWFRGAGVMNDFGGTCGTPGAWVLDPNYIANGNALTNSAGGGSGGYTYANANADACVSGPSYPANFISPGVPAADVLVTAWSGDNRQALGGMGGRPIASSGMQRQIFFGGGGGAGDGNNSANADGGDGGGVVFLVTTGNISGTGTIQANGENGANTIGSGNDAPGGGGGGGTVLIQSGVISNTININANGGNGGNQTIGSNESEGPGGGGGGGVVSINATTDNSVKTVAGGINGRTTSIAITEFLADGATSGNTGSLAAIAVNLGYTTCETDLQISKTISNPKPNYGSNVTFSITVTNNGPRYTKGVVVTDVLPTGYSLVSTTPTTGTFTAPNWTVGNLAEGTSEALSIVATVNPAGIYNNTATVTSDLTDPAPSNNTATVTVDPNEPPVAVNDTAVTDWDTNVTFSLTGNDSDVDGTIDPLTIDLDTATAGLQSTFTVSGEGTYTANPDGTVMFDPLPSFSGETTPVTYTVEDNDDGISNAGSILITVNAPAIISGTVLNDANGLTDNQVNGTGTNAGGLNAVLVNNTTGDVAAVTAVLANGTYTLTVLPGDYSILITTDAATVGNTAPAVTLATGWILAGENIGSGTGSDGATDGMLALGVLSGNISNVNVGIEQLPLSNDVTVNNAVNPNETNTIVVPTLTGSDAEDGAYNGTGNTLVINSVPGNAILYYNELTLAAGDTIKNYDPALLTLDPDDGLLTVTFTYTEIDAALNGSAVDATVNIIFSSIDVSVTVGGAVFNDANGLTDGTVNGPGTDAGGLNVVLVDDATGDVVDFTAVQPDGLYSFAGVQPGDYSILITTNTPVIGNAAPAVVLPAGWISTGEYNGGGAGDDGSADGILPLGSISSDISLAFLGIEQLPVSNDVTVNNAVNPNGTNTIVVPTLTGSDAEDGAYNGTGNTLVINSVPGNAILYYNELTLAAGDTIKNYDPALLTLDPDDGLLTVTFTYTEIDAALNGSAVDATVNIIFSSIDVSVTVGGAVFNDANGLTDGTVNGPGTDAGGLNVVLVDNATGDVVDFAAVQPDGLYSFAGVQPGDYSILITTNSPVIGNAAPAVVLPAGWINTGEYNGAGAGDDGSANGILPLGNISTNINDAFLGIEQPPVSNNVNANNEVNPGGTNTIVVPTLTGSDAEDGVYDGTGNTDVIVISSLPSNGTLYYNGLAVVAGDTIQNYNPALLTIDPADGLITVTFGYTEIDAALNGSATNGTVSITFTSALPVTLISFTAVKDGSTALLKWSTAQEINSSYFELERSADGSAFKPIGSVKAKGNSNLRSDYQFIDNAPLNGNNFYRFKEVDIDGHVQYSPVATVRFDQNAFVLIYPNPVVTEARIRFSGSNWINKTAQINILTAEGKLVMQKRIGSLSQVEKLNVSNLTAGSYIIQVITNTATVSKTIQVMRQ